MVVVFRRFVIAKLVKFHYLCILSLFKPRMIAREGVAEQLVGDMRVDFCRAHAGVAEHLLYGKQVSAAFEQVGSEAVAESVWADGLSDAVFLG